MLKRQFWATPLLLCGLLTVCTTARADIICELGISGVTLAVTPHKIAAHYRLNLKGLPTLRDQLRDGAQVVVEGDIRLLRHNTLLPNDELDGVHVEWMVRHDPLTREFVITDKWHETRRAPHLDSLLTSVWRDLRVTLEPKTPPEPGDECLVRFQLAVRYAQVPPWLEKAMIFWSRDLSPALEYEQLFTLPPQEPEE